MMNIQGIPGSEEEQQIWYLLREVPDPEVPVLSVIDLGIIRTLRVIHPGRSVEITVTPTYSGCPAMDVISINIRMALLQHGYTDVRIKTVLSPAWTTDWMSEGGKQKLKVYGIAPPGKTNNNGSILFGETDTIQCPQCRSYHTIMISEFGSTACKSLYKCNDCGEPFDYFKCH
jgi:ring-1,2-phenylacetyl-CoA epoxidase subunit PaaD